MIALLFAGGVIAFVVVFVVLISNASFTVTSKSTGNSFTAGNSGLSLSKPTAIIDAANMKAGQTRSGDIQVTNTGDQGVLSVTPKGAGTAPSLAAALKLKITPTGSPGTVLYDGTLAAATRIPLGTFGNGQTGSWTLALSLPATINPALAGTSMNVSFDWETRSP